MALKNNKVEVGQIFGYWRVEEINRRKILCLCTGCSNGTRQTIDKWDLLRGKSRSCGCQKKILTNQKCLEKYGVEHHTQSQQYREQLSSIQEKTKQTNLEKYGVEYSSQAESVREKRLTTIQEKYGVDNVGQVEAFKAKKIQTSLEKYGVENPSSSEEIKLKKRRICQERYGEDTYMDTTEFREKAAQTNLERYGARSFSQTEEFKVKFRETSLEKYGVESAMHTPEARAKAINTNIKKYGVESFSQTDLFNQKMVDASLAKYGVPHHSYLPEHRNKLKKWCEENPDKVFTSQAESEILEWVRTFYPSARKYRKQGNELDIFIPELKLGIEYNGLYWHSARFRNNRYHLEKTQYFAKLGIQVIHIFEHEWRDRQQALKGFLRSALKKNDLKIGARACQFIWSASLKCKRRVKDFLDTYHIQGAVKCKYVIQIIYKGELIGAATFGRHHRNSADWVLSRFCVKQDVTIQGGLAKISQVASLNLQTDLLSWADYRLSNGNGYKQAGWVQEQLLPPDYFYYKHHQAITKQSRIKSVVKTPPDMTEYEHAKLDGLERVWDCGKIRFRYKFESKDNFEK